MKEKKSGIIAVLSRLTIVLLVIACLAIVANSVFYFLVINAETARYDLTGYANSFADASHYLTDEVRAYAATGDEVHYENYWHEVNVAKNRDKNLQLLESGGITDEEKAFVEEMSKISDNLIPLEKRAMELVKGGDKQGALDIVYGDFYNESIARISALRIEFLQALNKRSADNILTYGVVHEIINAFAWVLMGAVILLQLYRKKYLYKIAYVDELTEGHNYKAFREMMTTGKEVNGGGFVVSADLRDFSTINNTCGVPKGDKVICELYRVLNEHTRKGELVAHVVGDRFAMFWHCESRAALIDRLTALRDDISALSAPLEVPHLSPKFGIREIEDPSNPELGYGDANFAKQGLKYRADYFYMFFDENLQRSRIEDRRIEENFERAIKENRFEMWYQPQYGLKAKSYVSAEALVRWRGEDGKIIPPKNFIPLFERNGMIARLDEVNFETVCSHIRAWLDEGIKVVPVSVNVSRSSLLYRDIVDRYVKILNSYNLPASYIKLEITESAIVSSETISDLIKDFRSHGFRILVDDFGSGYSSLYLLTKDYYDNIKIDKSIVDCIGTNAGDSLVNAIINLSHQFGMTVTAEGVEVVEQSELLDKLGCDNIQGYYYSKPLHPDDYKKLLQDPSANFGLLSSDIKK